MLPNDERLVVSVRIAIVSDIHGNRTAFEAVLADLRQTSPDLILHGGDLADSGASPIDIVDRVRDLGWRGVVGNTDEMLFNPKALDEFARLSPKVAPLLGPIRDMAAAVRDALGADRLAWLSGLARIQIHDPIALVHASPESAWQAPIPDASDAELASIYAPLGQPMAVYAHIHRPYVQRMPGLLVANTGSVSLPYDGDRRAAYLLLDGSEPSIRRVEYDVDRELKALTTCHLPHAGWVAKMLDTGRFQMP